MDTTQSATKHPLILIDSLSNCGFGMNRFWDPWGSVKRDSLTSF